MRAPLIVPALVVGLVASHRPSASPVSAPTPLSPAEALLLIDGSVTADTLSRWGLLVDDARPLARATVARVAMVRGLPQLGPALHARLRREDDSVAAGEMMRALGRIGPGSSEDVLFGAAERFAPTLDATLAHSLALRGPSALAFLPRLLPLRLGAAWREFFAWATAGDAAALDAAARAVLDADSHAAWRELLGYCREHDRRLSDATLARSLERPAERVREETYWHLLAVDHGRRPKDSPLVAALNACPEAGGAGSQVSNLAHRLLARSQGAKGDDVQPLAALPTGDALRVAGEPAALGRLTRDERRALARVAGLEDGHLAERVEEEKRRRELRARPRGPARVVRTVNLPPGLAPDVLAATGCTPDGATWALLEVIYGDGGRVDGLSMPPAPDLTPECIKAARALLLGGIEPGASPPGRGDSLVLLLPMSADFFACSAGSRRVSQGGSPPERPGGRIPEPRKVLNVRPVYPRDLRQQRIEGTSVLEAIVTPSGCIGSLRTLNRVHPGLEHAAMRAVRQWRYEPTLVEGTPVPVVITVTVSFRLVP